MPSHNDPAFIAAMEDVLEVYCRPHDPRRPVVCLDEASKQLFTEVRAPIPMKPGQPARHDYEYERNGTANMFMIFAPLEGVRHVKVTERRTAKDYGQILKNIADIYWPDTDKIILVNDNLNTHKPASLYEAFPAAEARRLVERFGRVGRSISAPAPRRTERDTLASFRSHQANIFVFVASIVSSCCQLHDRCNT